MSMHKIIKLLTILVFLLLVASCASLFTWPKNIKRSNTTSSILQNSSFLETYKLLAGKKYGSSAVVRNKKFTLDCIGLVSAVYWAEGFDITVDFHKYSGNGVSCLFQSLSDRGALYKNENGKIIKPQVGDIIFWDNTWDRNENGKFGDDPLTHAGLVMQVDSDATIHYLHASIVSGVVIEQMNIERPTVAKDAQGKKINSSLYMASYVGNPKNPPRFLAGDLFKAFGNYTTINQSF